ncbi:MAG: hypothetical protein A3C46_00590 [Deltaproteobacteria bacterium RIFCSPHIGHO2_02_FULL_44_16]|nr:MAG: hypothetical protein A3C46_00590 [Deltaproteobacteria bacterium RIFCSPHIGHO2_02_FULL_44_16]
MQIVNSKEIKQCQSCRVSFTIEPEDFAFYEKAGVLPPKFCPDCRLQLRLLFRNERTFYKRKCDLCGKNMISSYAPEYTYPVYCQKCWWSDKWDPYKYGREYDFSRPFLEQYKEILYSVPVINLMNDDGIGSINCEYAYDRAFSKNCYLTVCGWHNENIAYGYQVNYCKEVFDCFYVNHSELTYQSLSSDKCYGCQYCMISFNSRNCFLGIDLRNCSDCIMCVGLRNKQYCILNQQYSKEEYLYKKQEMCLESRKMIEKYLHDFQEFSLKFPRKFATLIKSVNSTGDNLINCKNSKNCFFYPDLEDCRYMLAGDGGKDSYDCNNTGHVNLCYYSVTPDNSYGSVGSIFCWKCNRVEYSNNCHSSDNLLGCSALKKASYAILNKKYSKEDYIAMREKIIKQMKEAGEWGEFLPKSFSPYAYNESAAQEWSMLIKSDALAQGFRWREPDNRNYAVTVPPDRVPDEISKATDDILNEIIGCAHQGLCGDPCTTAFKVIPQELEFYRKMNIPLPILCPNCRHYQRLKLRNPPKLWHRTCECEGQKSKDKGPNQYTNTATHIHGEHPCPNEFETSYAPERPEIVYCESCYNAEVV